MINFTRLYTLTDEMKFDADNDALDRKALRARLKYYRSQINRELASIVLDNARIECGLSKEKTDDYH